MTDIFTWIKLAFAGVCGGIAYIFGGLDSMLRILIIMMIIDYITGVSAAIYRKDLCSRTGFNGILKRSPYSVSWHARIFWATLWALRRYALPLLAFTLPTKVSV